MAFIFPVIDDHSSNFFGLLRLRLAARRRCNPRWHAWLIEYHFLHGVLGPLLDMQGKLADGPVEHDVLLGFVDVVVHLAGVEVLTKKLPGLGLVF